MVTIEQLRQKAIADVSSITDKEKRIILGWATSEAMIVNVARATQGALTPEQLLEKAEKNAELLTKCEIQIIIAGFNYFTTAEESGQRNRLRRPGTPSEAIFGTLNKEDWHAHVTAMNLVLTALTKYLARMELLSKPAGWVTRIQEAGVPWGYTAFRSADTSSRTAMEWETIESCPDEMVGQELWPMKGAFDIMPLKVLGWVDVECNEDNVHQKFRSLKSAAKIPVGALHNTFILITNESMEKSPFPNIERLGCWAWAYDPDWDPSSPSLDNLRPDNLQYGNFSGSESSACVKQDYQGRLKVAWHALFTWFYGERLENIKTMKELWIESIQCPHEVWTTFAPNGIEPYSIPVYKTREPVDRYDNLRMMYG